MSKRIILSVLGALVGMILMSVTVFAVVQLLEKQIKIEDIEWKNEKIAGVEKLEGSMETVEETTLTFEPTEEASTDTIIHEIAVPFGVIEAPVICGPKERLDTKRNVCKRVI
jgi:hypothetical protein